MANAKSVNPDVPFMRGKIKQFIKENITLLIATIAFIITFLFFLYTYFLPNDTDSLVASEGSGDMRVFSEYAYYDITSDEAYLYVNFADSEVELNEQEKVIVCKDTYNNPAIVEYEDGGVYHISNLSENTTYACEIAVPQTSANRSKSFEPIGYFQTIDPNYLNITEARYDAYDVGFNVVFRASWQSPAKDFLLTKSVLDNQGLIISQEEVLLSRYTYTDNKLEAGVKYVYEMRAISGEFFGDPISFDFYVPLGEKIEDGLKSEPTQVYRIIPDQFMVSEAYDLTQASKIDDINIITTSIYSHFLVLHNGVPLLTKNIARHTGYILAGAIVENEFKLEAVYLLDDISDDYILGAYLDGETIVLTSFEGMPNLSFTTPEGESKTIPVSNGRANIGDYYPYIFLTSPNGAVKISQPSETIILEYDEKSRKLSWSSSEKFNSFLVNVLNPEGKKVYSVLLDGSEYIFDKNLPQQSLRVEVLGYADSGIRIIGRKNIASAQNKIGAVENIVIQKAGNSVAIEWKSEPSYSHIIELSVKGNDIWVELANVPAGENSHLLRGITNLNSGNYSLRITPKSSISRGDSSISECYLRVSKLKDYQILCE